MADLLRAFAGAFGSNDGVRLEIGGDGELRPSLESQAAELGLGGRVDFLGSLSRDQVRDALWRANAVVSAARVETFGVVPMRPWRSVWPGSHMKSPISLLSTQPAPGTTRREPQPASNV